jgi:hypothetical protein
VVSMPRASTSSPSAIADGSWAVLINLTLSHVLVAALDKSTAGKGCRGTGSPYRSRQQGRTTRPGTQSFAGMLPA